MDDLRKILDIKPSNLMPSMGKILISEPFLNDFFFERSVVLLAEHNEEGSFGVVLNNPTKYNLQDITADFPSFDVPVYLGGPVQTNNLFYIHTIGDIIENSLPILDGLYWGGNIEVIKQMIAGNAIKPNQIRFFIGYSGWVAGQLNDELEINSWVVSKIKTEEVMTGDFRKLWQQKVKSMGEPYELWLNFPVDPASN